MKPPAHYDLEKVWQEWYKRQLKKKGSEISKESWLQLIQDENLAYIQYFRESMWLRMCEIISPAEAPDDGSYESYGAWLERTESFRKLLCRLEVSKGCYHNVTELHTAELFMDDWCVRHRDGAVWIGKVTYDLWGWQYVKPQLITREQAMEVYDRYLGREQIVLPTGQIRLL